MPFLALKYLLVIVIAALPVGEVLIAILVGAVVGLPLLYVIPLALLVNLAPVLYLVQSNTSWRPNFLNKSGAQKAEEYFEKHGMRKLGLYAPVLTGIYVAALVALVKGHPRNDIIYWITAGVLMWTGILGAVLVFIVHFVTPMYILP